MTTKVRYILVFKGTSDIQHNPGQPELKSVKKTIFGLFSALDEAQNVILKY
jgi:hypothetical protein